MRTNSVVYIVTVFLLLAWSQKKKNHVKFNITRPKTLIKDIIKVLM